MLPYYRKNLIVLWLTSFLAGASWNQVIPFLSLYLLELGATPDNVSQWSGLVFSMHFMSALVMMPVWGKISDRLGRKPMAVRAGLSLSGVYFLMSVVQAPWQLAFCRFLNGAVTGFLPMSTALLATNTPKEFASRYVASLQTAIAAGNLLGPVLGATLAGIFGIRGAMRVSGTAVLISAILVLVLVEERHKPQGKAVPKTSLIDDFRFAVKSPTLWVVLFINVVANLGSVGIQPILALHVEDLVNMQAATWATLRESIIAIVFMLPAIGFVLTATRWVRWSEKAGVQRVVVFALIGAGITSILSGLTQNIFVFLVIFFISGLFIAALRPIASAIIATDVDPAFHGRAFGMQTSAQTIGGLIGPLTGGVLAGLWGNRSVFFGVGFMLLLSPLIMRKRLEQIEGQSAVDA